MKKKYKSPEMEIEWLECDIVCTSGFGGSSGNDDDDEIEEPGDD